MTRIYRHTIQDAPEASRPLLEGIVPFSPTGKLLNMHAQMAHSPAVLAAYASIRQATARYGTLDPRVRSALMLASAAVSGSAYAQAVTSLLAVRAGWSQAEVLALREGRPLGEDKTDALVDVVREASTRSGQVGDATWQRAAECGWSSEHLTEAFAFLALTVFTAYFLNYAQTPMDLPAGPAARPEAGPEAAAAAPAAGPAAAPAAGPAAGPAAAPAAAPAAGPAAVDERE